MRTFYDFRDTDFKNPKKYPLQGYVILKNKKFWFLWIYKDVKDIKQFIKSFIVAPRTVYLYDVYMAKGFWDGLFNYLKRK